MKSMLAIALIVLYVGCTSGGDSLDFLASECTKLYDPPGEACNYKPLILKTKKVTVNDANCGKDFDAKDFDRVVQVVWEKADENKLYTFVFGEYEGEMNWGVGNINGSTLKKNGSIGIHNQAQLYKAPEDPKILVTCEAFIYVQKKWNLIPNDGLTNTKKFKDFVQESDLFGPVAGVEVKIRPRPPS